MARYPAFHKVEREKVPDYVSAEIWRAKLENEAKAANRANRNQMMSAIPTAAKGVTDVYGAFDTHNPETGARTGNKIGDWASKTFGKGGTPAPDPRAAALRAGPEAALGSTAVSAPAAATGAQAGGTLQAALASPLAQAAPLSQTAALGGGTVAGPMSIAPTAAGAGSAASALGSAGTLAGGVGTGTAAGLGTTLGTSAAAAAPAAAGGTAAAAGPLAAMGPYGWAALAALAIGSQLFGR